MTRVFESARFLRWFRVFVIALGVVLLVGAIYAAVIGDYFRAARYAVVGVVAIVAIGVLALREE